MTNTKIKFSNSIQMGILFLSILVFAGNTAFASEINEENLSYLINKERTYYGMVPLRIDSNLDLAADSKAEHMLVRNYFEHYAYGLSPWDFMKNSQYNYLYAGENLAMDFETAEGMVNAWMDSDLHRANILNPDYEDMGIGVIKGAYTENGQIHETVIVSNMFGRKKPVIVEVFNNFVKSFSNYLNYRSVRF